SWCMAYGRVSFWGTWPNGQNRTGLVPRTDWTAALSAAIWNTGGYTSGHRRDLCGFLVELFSHRVNRHLGGPAGCRVEGRTHERLGARLASPELDKSPVGRIAAGGAVVATGRTGAATDADAHHGAA